MVNTKKFLREYDQGQLLNTFGLVNVFNSLSELKMYLVQASSTKLLKLQAASFKPQAASFKLQAASVKLHDS